MLENILISSRRQFKGRKVPIQGNTSVKRACRWITESCPNLNVSLDRVAYLLSDFGISQEIKHSDFDVRVGDNLYLSPELSLFNLPLDEQLKKADIYALGLVLAQLLLGKPM